MINVADRLLEVKEYYFSIKLREVRSLIAQGKPIISLAIGSPDLDPPQSVKDALANANTHGYQSYQGLPEFRNAIGNFYKNNYDVSLNPEKEILPLMGSKEGILHISMAYLNAGDQVLIPNPGYPTYTSVTKLVQAKPIFYDLTEKKNWQPDFEALEKLNLAKVKLMWVNYPHMPTGTKADKDLFQKLIAFAKKHEILIINDNPYSFVLNDNPQSILAVEGAKEVAIELNSLSKSFNMAGWRVGMVVGKESYIQNILKVKSNMDSGMYYGIQKGAIAALQLDKNWFEQNNKIYKKRREIIWEICDALKCSYHKNDVGMFVWAKIPEGQKSEEVCDKLLYQNNVFVTPGTVFGSNGEGYIRFSLCIAEDKLRTVLKRIAYNG